MVKFAPEHIRFMFRHFGESRTLSHNIRLATLLSFVAGLVNVSGFLATHRLTSNVTGHFAFFMEEVVRFDWGTALLYLLLVLFFLLGAFASAFLMELMSTRSTRLIYVVPIVIESAMLLLVFGLSQWNTGHYPDVLASMLLFAMGMQNALVTKISGAVVRTTHLTGLFTDLGIELSELLFYKQPEQRHKLTRSIVLRITIILSFFAGGVLGGLAYTYIGLQVLAGAAALLLLGLLSDY